MVCADHRKFKDEDITFQDIIFAQELLDRADRITEKIRKYEKEKEMDSDLDKAVKKILNG